MRIGVRSDALLAAVLVGCALITTGVVVYRELLSPLAGSSLPPERKAVFIEDWESQLGSGVQLGAPDARVKIVEFADFECPFCATFHQDIKALRKRYPADIALSFIHYPLSGHRFAIPAARAAECAGEQGRFEEMMDELFEQQSEFGLKPWTEFAARAGISDRAAFEQCTESTNPMPRVVSGQTLGDRLGIYGTPTVIINGWRLGRPARSDELDRMVRAILAGGSPVSESGEPIG